MKTNIISRLYTLLFFLGIFFLPFNAVNGSLPIGEFKNETSFYFFFLGFSLLLFDIKNYKSIFPSIKFLYPIILFILWNLLSSLLNIEGIESSYFKQTSGIERFFKQFLVLIFSLFLFLIYYWNVIKHFSNQDILIKIRIILLSTLIFCSFIGALQIAIIYFNLTGLKKVINLAEYIPFIKITFFGGSNRIATISYEPPFLAIYLISIFGWMLSYILTSSKWWKGIPLILVLLLTYFSGSRSGMIIITFQLLLFIIILLVSPNYKKFLISTVINIIIFIFFVCIINSLSSPQSSIYSGENLTKERLESLDFKNNLNTSISNKTRFGMQYASLMVFKDHPLIGVGLGQQTYYSRAYYPDWATTNNYEFKEFYNNEKVKSFPPGYNIYTRILAELGIIGLLLFLFIILSCLFFSYKLIDKKANNKNKILGICLFLSFVGLSINWLQIDTFRIFTFWIYLAILIKTLQTNESNHSINTSL